MTGPEEWQPDDPKLQETWRRLSAEAKQRRFVKALRRLDALRQVFRRADGESERKAVKRKAAWTSRSSLRRWRDRYEERGFAGLLNWQVAPPSAMPAELIGVICTLVRANPQMPVASMVAHLAKFHEFQTSTTKVKRVLRGAGLNRPRGPAPGRGKAPEQRLELAGAKLLEVAAVESGYLAALTAGIVEHVRGLEKPEGALPRDTEHRDEYGRFKSSYNERYRKQPGDVIGPGFESVSVKRGFKDPSHLQIAEVRPEIIERKLLALWYSPLLGGGRWDGIRVSRGQLLEELCGFAYMPSTLERFTTELKYAGVASTLWEVHAGLWQTRTAAWGDPRRAAVLFIDGTTKSVWTRFFAESTKVSGVGRTMPGLETVAFHSGYGVPLWMLTHSGRAPLVRDVPLALEQIERTWGVSSTGRIVVLDAESNSLAFILGLEAAQRAVVTRFRPSWLNGKRIFNRNNFRPYRNGDRVRSGVVDFDIPKVNKDDEQSALRMRVVEIERRSTGAIVYLGASTKLDEKTWKPQDLADLYFARWSAQEANFRAVNQALGLKEVHGYGKQLVTNISVVTKLDEMEQRAARAEERLKGQEQRAEALRQRLQRDEQALARLQRRQDTIRQKLDDQVYTGRWLTPRLDELVREQGDLAAQVQSRPAQNAALRKKLEAAQGKVQRTHKRLDGYQTERATLETRREIFAHDVELDSLFSLLKVGLVFLVTYVLRNYLGDAKMDPATFLERVATLPARLTMTPHLELLTFDHNTRDPDVMGLLRANCEAINKLGLRTRSGRRLQIHVDPEPELNRPRPPGSRTGSGDRFKR